MLLKLLIVLIVSFKNFVSYYDTITIKNNLSEHKLNNYLYYFITNRSNNIKIDSFLKFPEKYKFFSLEARHINLGYSNVDCWIKFHLKNESKHPINYILEISNPDIDYIDFYEINSQKKIVKAIKTGELRLVNQREIPHRNFLFLIRLNPSEKRSYYIKTNNSGHAFFVPLNLIEQTRFYIVDNFKEMFNWIIYGILAFIIFFNIYSYFLTKEKLNFHYAAYVIFALIFFFYYDGYYYLLNLDANFEKLKMFIPALFIISLLSFTQSFAGNKFPRIIFLIKSLKLLSLFFAACYMLPYPYSIISDIGLPILIIITVFLIIYIATYIQEKSDRSTQLFLIAYFCIFLGMAIHQLKEFNILQSTFFTENSTKIGLSAQCILLSIALIEHFKKIQQENQKTIEENLKKIEAQNKELERANLELEKLSIVARETDNGIAIYDNEGNLEWCNFGFEKLYETNSERLKRNQRDNIFSITPNENIYNFFKEVVNNENVVRFESLLEFEGRRKWIQTTLSPYSKSGKVLKVIAIDSDITNLKKYEEELKKAKEKAEESDKLKTLFLGNISHEIRTPLNGILGFTELLKNPSLSQDRKERYLKLIQLNGHQLLSIIEDIVDISLIEANQLKISYVPVSISSIIKNEIIEFSNVLKKNMDKNNIEIKYELKIPEGQDNIYTDPLRLKQVLINLIKNSLKFTEEGYVKIGAFISGKNIIFYVEDSGIGIPPEKRDYVFDRFRQGEETLSRKYGGIGLGLTIAKGIIEKLGGKIWIDPDFETGTRVCFTLKYLPVTTEVLNQQNQLTSSTNLSEKLMNKKILIVEDHDMSYEYLYEILSPYCKNIIRVTDGNQAVEITKSENFDIILMDINLPHMDGNVATRLIRINNPKIPIIAQTAYVMEYEKEVIYESGATDIIAKPINPEELFNKILKYLDSNN